LISGTDLGLLNALELFLDADAGDGFQIAHLRRLGASGAFRAYVLTEYYKRMSTVMGSFDDTVIPHRDILSGFAGMSSRTMAGRMLVRCCIWYVRVRSTIGWTTVSSMMG
jgi:hypothetical protein